MVGAAGAGDGGKGFEGACSAPLSPPTEEYAPNPPGVGIFQTRGMVRAVKNKPRRTDQFVRGY